MKSVFFVDDDMLTLNKLRGIIDWNARGYVIAGQATDGEAAVRHILKLQPDLVLLDINLPKMDGVAVAREAKDGAPGTRLLILSNYDTFEYVRQTMKYGACDYLLKHELTAELLSRKLDELDAQREREQLSAQRDSWFAGVAKQKYLRDVALGKPLPDNQHAFMRAQPEFSSQQSVLAVARIANLNLFTCFDGEPERQRIITSLDILAQNVFSTAENGLLTALGNGKFVALFSSNGKANGQGTKARAQTAMRLLASSAQRMLNITLQFCIGDSVCDIRLLPKAYEEAERHLHAEFGAQIPASIGIREERELMDALSALDTSRTELALRHVFCQCGQESVEPLLSVSRRFMHTHGIALSDVYTRQFQNAFRLMIPFEKKAHLITEHFRHLLSQAATAVNRHYSLHISSAIAYIHANYARDISLVTAAEHVGISAPYLSRQFPKEVGVSFVEYLTAYRIEAAKRLLKQPGAKIKDVCRQAGFSNYNYFLRVFKKKTGFTVTQNTSEADRRIDERTEG